jgi:23S rRNA pseudouridine2605 synthase
MAARDEDFDNAPTAPRLIRLQRYLASCGLGSRRACEEFITMGRVTVDGEIITEQGKQINPQVNKIALDGQKLKMERKRYYVFNKPPGVLCTNKDPQGRTRVIDFFPKEGPRVFSVGRLDEDSEGLLIVTNDGDLAQKLAHPSYRIFRTYHVLVAGHPDQETLDELRKGIYFEEGRFRVEGVKSLKRQGDSTWCEVILAEGHNREVRRLFSRVGHKVMKLQRVAFGPIFLGKMGRGEIRDIRRDELERLFGMLERNESTREEERERRPRPASRPKTGQRRMNDGDLLNRTSRKVPPGRQAAPKRTGQGPDRRPRAEAPARPQKPEGREPRESREPRGLGIGDVSDEQMMGLAERPAGRPATGSRSSSGPKKFASSGDRSPRRPTGERPAGAPSAGSRPKGALGTRRSAEPGRDERRPDQRSAFKTGKAASVKKAAGKPAGKPKRPSRGDQPSDSFGRRSPGQPKRPGKKPPRGR